MALSLGGGTGVDISGRAALSPTIAVNKIGGEDDDAAGLSLNIWFHISFFGVLAASYAFENGDFFYAAGVGFGF